MRVDRNSCANEREEGVRRAVDIDETKKKHFESQAHPSFLRPTWHKKACLRRDFDLATPEAY